MDNSWKELHDIIFDKDNIILFSNKNWKTVEFEYNLRHNKSAYELVRQLCVKNEDSYICVTDVELEPMHQFPMIAAFNEESIRRIFLGPLSGVVSHAFGRSARWGAIFTVDDDRCIIGYANDQPPATIRPRKSAAKSGNQ